MTRPEFFRAACAILTTFGLFACVAAASGQSLADVAKKEKERREKNETAGAKVITDRELTSSYGGLRDTPRSSAQSATAAEGAENSQQSETAESEQEADAVDETQTREYWQNRVNTVKEKIAQSERALQESDWGEGIGVGVDPRGQNNLAERQQAEQRVAAAKAELAALREEARRQNVPAGWVR